MATQADLAFQMVAQLRALDPSISAEVGTPERKIIDTVAQALAESSVDLNIVDGQLDIDSKFGADLEKFVSLFGFGRQKGTAATGFVTFGRTVASAYDILIRDGTQVIAPSVATNGQTNALVFVTTSAVTLPAGSLSVIAPVRCTVPGTVGNVATGTITTFSGVPILGITSITNEVPIQNGVDVETDEELKVRFKNTVFRNVSGTNDQFLALAISTLFTSKANVVGPISRYREYVQIPQVDDATPDPDSGIGGNGLPGNYTTALSTIPYSKHVFETIPFFVSNGQNNVDTVFYRGDTDFLMNLTPGDRNQGDTYRGWQSSSGLNPLSDAAATFQPNLTFFNVYTGLDTSVIAVRPDDIVLFEHSYMSTESRNDWDKNITNCVDVFINGSNPTVADTVIARPQPGLNLFVADQTNRYYYKNFRRVGEPNHTPVPGNIFTALFWQPVMDLPDQITSGTSTYFKGIHYWAVEDVSALRNTVRARNGVEWAATVPGWFGSDSDRGPYTGDTILANAATSATILNYTYDKNVVDLQSALDANKQTTTDILGHRSVTRYFKLDVTVMYSPGVSIADTNQSVHDNLVAFFDGQYFGTTIQLSDILQVVHNTIGIDNVRWSKELLDARSLAVDGEGNFRDRVVECNISGNSVTGVVLDRLVAGTPSSAEIWQLYLTGGPTSGSYTIAQGESISRSIPWNYDAFNTVGSMFLGGIDVSAGTATGTGSLDNPFIFHFNANGFQANPLTVNAVAFTGPIGSFNGDFYLKDNELPALPDLAQSGDTLPGLVIRPRAQNTWSQL